MDSGSGIKERSDTQYNLLMRLRSRLRYGTSLRWKLVVLVSAIALVVVGALFWFSLASLRASIAAIYESRARSVAAVIAKSIQEKDYILYYSDALNQDIEQLLERYDDVMNITVIGQSARGFITVASTDPTSVGVLATEDDQLLFDLLSDVRVTRMNTGSVAFLRAYDPIFSGADLAGVIEVDMSLAEQARYIRHLSWRYALAALVGIVLLGVLLYLALLSIVTKPVGRIARAVGEMTQRKYDVEVSVPFRRIPGTRQRDEVSQLIDGFNLMAKVIHSHEQELRKLVVLDEVTGAYTVDHLHAELDRELQKTTRYKHPTSLLIVEVMGLEARSEKEADELLIRTAGFLVSNLRNVDVLFRIAESRFVALLPETPPDGAAVAAARLEAQVPDVANRYAFPVRMDIRHLGWGEEGAPATDELIDRLSGPLDALDG